MRDKVLAMSAIKRKTTTRARTTIKARVGESDLLPRMEEAMITEENNGCSKEEDPPSCCCCHETSTAKLSEERKQYVYQKHRHQQHHHRKQEPEEKGLSSDSLSSGLHSLSASGKLSMTSSAQRLLVVDDGCYSGCEQTEAETITEWGESFVSSTSLSGSGPLARLVPSSPLRTPKRHKDRKLNQPWPCAMMMMTTTTSPLSASINDGTRKLNTGKMVVEPIREIICDGFHDDDDDTVEEIEGDGDDKTNCVEDQEEIEIIDQDSASSATETLRKQDSRHRTGGTSLEVNDDDDDDDVSLDPMDLWSLSQASESSEDQEDHQDNVGIISLAGASGSQLPGNDSTMWRRNRSGHTADIVEETGRENDQFYDLQNRYLYLHLTGAAEVVKSNTNNILPPNDEDEDDDEVSLTLSQLHDRPCTSDRPCTPESGPSTPSMLSAIDCELISLTSDVTWNDSSWSTSGSLNSDDDDHHRHDETTTGNESSHQAEITALSKPISSGATSTSLGPMSPSNGRKRLSSDHLNCFHLSWSNTKSYGNKNDGLFFGSNHSSSNDANHQSFPTPRSSPLSSQSRPMQPFIGNHRRYNKKKTFRKFSTQGESDSLICYFREPENPHE